MKINKWDWLLLLFVLGFSVVIYIFLEGKLNINLIFLIILLFGLSVGVSKKLIDHKRMKA